MPSNHQTSSLPKVNRRASTGSGSVSLPADLVSQSANRLRTVALLYAFIFFMAGYFPALWIPDARAHLFSSPLMWVPGLVAISVALVVALVVTSARVSPAKTLTIGLVFEVVGSYGIAAAEFLDPVIFTPNTRWFGLSWVAVWTLLFTIVIPTAPRRAVAAALASVSAVPVIIALMLLADPTSLRPSGAQFFFGLVFPYLLVVVMAYVGARVIYALGTEVTRARDLGSYQLEERLGAGGMGEVWRATHRMLARPAAIKLIRPSERDGHHGLVSETAQRRFEREAQAIASLRSPHTVNLFDFGISDNGTFYYVMELLDGLDADALVRRTGPVPAERAVHIVRQICHSLSEAESRGLVHRDIKPANIFLCRYGEDYDFVKVLDFGIVKATRDAPTETALTMEHAFRGTPAFTAPEQALGSATIDGRADIYSTGCVAYWLLTGQPVFSADTPLGLLVHHANTAPVPPSVRTELTIPTELDALVMRCLSKNPADRPQTARELSARLSAIDASAWTEERAREWWVRNQPRREI